MITEPHRARLSTAFLLLVVLTGWIVAPLVHEIEHALERAEMVHVHDVRDGVTLRTGCDAIPDLAEECPISLTKVQAVHGIHLPTVLPDVSDTRWTEVRRDADSTPHFLRPVRGPPVVV